VSLAGRGGAHATIAAIAIQRMTRSLHGRVRVRANRSTLRAKIAESTALELACGDDRAVVELVVDLDRELARIEHARARTTTLTAREL
jgi:hypothetical protein